MEFNKSFNLLMKDKNTLTWFGKLVRSILIWYGGTEDNSILDDFFPKN